MIQSIADHIKAKAPAYVVAAFLSGLTAFGTLLKAYIDANAWRSNLEHDIEMIKCKVGIEVAGSEICQLIPTIAEDIAKETGESPETD